MISSEVIEWIKSEEAQGLSDTKVRTILKQRNWPEEDIDLMIKLAHKKKVSWMPLILIFFLAIIAFFSSLALFGFHNTEEHFVFGFFGTLTLMIYSLIYYHKTNKRESFTQFFIINFSSFSITSLITLFFFNIIVLIMYWLHSPLSVLVILLIYLICAIAFFYLYFGIVSKLSRHFQGYFDLEAYLIYKHLPFKILNVNWNKKWTLLKYPLFVIIILSLFLFVVYVQEVNSAERGFSNTLDGIKESLSQRESDRCYSLIYTKMNVSSRSGEVFPLHREGEKYFYDISNFLDIDRIFYDCSFSDYSCKEKPFNPSLLIEKQINFKEGVTSIFSIRNTSFGNILVISSDHPLEQQLNCPFFTDEEMKLKITQETEKERRRVITYSFEKEPLTINIFNFPQKVNEVVLWTYRLGLDLGFNSVMVKMIKNSSDLNANFSKDILNSEKNIRSLYPRFLSLKNAGEYPDYPSFLNTRVNSNYYWNEALFNSKYGNDYLWNLWSWRLDLRDKLNALKYEYPRQRIAELYQTIDVGESEQSKAIRLKIIELLLAKQIYVNGCWQESFDFNNFNHDQLEGCHNEIIQETGLSKKDLEG